MVFVFYIIVGIFSLAIIISLVYFLSPRLSPIPYFPSNWKDVPAIVATILENGDWRLENSEKHTIIDLGAGTGTVIFPATLEAYRRGLKTTFVAVEVNPFLVFIMHLRRLFHPHRKAINIVRADMFNIDRNYILKSLCQSADPNLNTIYLYVGNLEDTKVKKMLSQFPTGTKVVSYMYKIPGWEKRLKTTKSGQHSIYVYQLGLRISLGSR